MQVLIKISLEGRIKKKECITKQDFKGQQKMSDKCQTFNLKMEGMNSGIIENNVICTPV